MKATTHLFVLALASFTAAGEDQHVSLLQTSVSAHHHSVGKAECKAARSEKRDAKKAVKAAREALKAAKAALKDKKGAVVEACPVKEKTDKEPDETEDKKNLGYILTKGVSCGWSGGCGGDKNQAYINNGNRMMTASASDVSSCEELCDANSECDGFCLVGSVCYFRKDTECNNMVPTAGRSCWQKPKGRKCADGQFQGGEACSQGETAAAKPELGEGMKGKGIWGGKNCGHMDKSEIPYSTDCTRFVMCEDKPACHARGISSAETCMNKVAAEDGCQKDFFEWRSYNSHCFCNPKGRTWVPSTVHAPSVTYPMR